MSYVREIRFGTSTFLPRPHKLTHSGSKNTVSSAHVRTGRERWRNINMIAIQELSKMQLVYLQNSVCLPSLLFMYQEAVKSKAVGRQKERESLR